MSGGQGPNQGSGEGPGGGGGGNIFGALLKGGLKGLGSGLQNYAGQQDAIQNRGGGPGQIPMAQQPQVQLPGMTPNGQMNNPFKPIRGNNLAFYGGDQ
jgi:hypothetical protein